jgi:hypothetical protein
MSQGAQTLSGATAYFPVFSIFLCFTANGYDSRSCRNSFAISFFLRSYCVFLEGHYDDMKAFAHRYQLEYTSGLC